MKHMLIIITFAFLSGLPIQKSNPTSLEKAVFNQLNIYRKEHGLKALAYDSVVTTVARYHSTYLSLAAHANHICHYDKEPHDEQFDLPNFKELSFNHRAEMAPEKGIFQEIQIQTNPLYSKQTTEDFAKQTIALFASSPPHNEAMLTEDDNRIIMYVGVGVTKHPSNGNTENHYAVNIDFGYKQID